MPQEPQGAGRVPRINTPNERAILKGNARFREIMKSVAQLQTLSATTQIQSQIDELLAERDAIIIDRRQRNVLRAKELKAAGYKRPTQGIQLIPLPGEG